MERFRRPMGMRGPRIRAVDPRSPGYFHCFSRVVDKRKVFGEPEKAMFVRMMREYEVFCRVKVLTYCVMPNHFHVLVEVPVRPESLPSDKELLEWVSPFYSQVRMKYLQERFEELKKLGDESELKRFRETFFRQMWDLSWFIRLLKQRFTQWFNSRHDRVGTLWEERFRSVLVDGPGSKAMQTIAAYIDLNPVRARIVKRPEDYRWCGYAEIIGLGRSSEKFLETLRIKTIEEYRLWLYGEGLDTTPAPPQSRNSKQPQPADSAEVEVGPPIRGGLSQESVEAIFASGGRLTLPQLIRLRVRYFTAGAVIGSREFVDAAFRAHRKRFPKTRQDGARSFKHTEPETLYSLRDLRVRPIN